MVRVFGLAFGNSSSRKRWLIRAGPVLWVSLEVTGSSIGTTLKKTKLVACSIFIFNVLESGYNS